MLTLAMPQSLPACERKFSAARKLSVKAILMDHWQTYGRNYYSRHDYEAVDAVAANALMADLILRLQELPGQTFGTCKVTSADQFSYHDPVDGSVSHNQGLRINFDGGDRAVLRLSGTGTEGATLRVYLERYEPPEGDLTIDTQEALADIAAAVAEISELQARTGRTAPDVMT